MDGTTFDHLQPEGIIRAVEEATGKFHEGTIVPYLSYINRVYGIRDEDGNGEIIKFYRPGRWTREAIEEEHVFIRDCHEAELPVVPPDVLSNGTTLGSLEIGPDGTTVFFAVFPRRSGRNFDAERDEDWYRLGALVGRIHREGVKRAALHRLAYTPENGFRRFSGEILDPPLVHPDFKGELEEICGETIGLVSRLFSGVSCHRIHGDCHRGNILDRGEEGLLLMDFDDMATGPSVQDLWLLLPDRADLCRREITMMLDGYEFFLPFDRKELILIEPLRFMRMLYFLSWYARQRFDHEFPSRFPEWGSRAFWLKETEDLRNQSRVIRHQMETSDGLFQLF